MSQLRKEIQGLGLHWSDDVWGDNKLDAEFDAIINNRMAAYKETPQWAESERSLEKRFGYNPILDDAASVGRIINEIMQNAIDAIGTDEMGQILVYHSGTRFYFANTGSAIDRKGMDALLFAGMENKMEDHLGRFGLGFKSILGLCQGPTLYSRSISMRFGETAAQYQELAKHIDVELPLMRLPDRIHALEDAKHDSVLAELLPYFTTILVLDVFVQAQSAIMQYLENYHLETLLFAGKNVRLILINGEGVGRASSARKGEWLGRDGSVEVWRAELERPSGIEHGYYAELGTDAAWFLRDENVGHQGALWSYFPTASSTSIPGILHARWDLTLDRQNVLDSEHNRSLATSIGSLLPIASKYLMHEDDYGRYLDYWPPARHIGYSNVDSMIHQSFYESAATLEIVRNGNNVWCPPTEIRRRPDEITQVEGAVEKTVGVETLSEMLVHFLLEHPSRRERLWRLNVLRAQLYEVLTAIAVGRGVEGSTAAVSFGAMLHEQHAQAIAKQLRAAIIFLCTDGKLRPANESCVYLDPGDPPHGENVHYVVHEIVDTIGPQNITNVYGIPKYEATMELVRRILEQDHLDWHQTWNDIRETGVANVLHAMTSDAMTRLCVRNRDGAFMFHESVLHLPSFQDVRSASYMLLDEDYHQQELEVFREYGLCQPLGLRSVTKHEAWWAPYIQYVRESFQQADGRGVAQQNALHLPQPFMVPNAMKAWDVHQMNHGLVELVVRYILAQDGTAYEKSVTIHHANRNGIVVQSPLVYFMTHHVHIRHDMDRVHIKYFYGRTLSLYDVGFKVLPYPDENILELHAGRKYDAHQFAVDVTKTITPDQSVSLSELYLSMAPFLSTCRDVACIAGNRIEVQPVELTFIAHGRIAQEYCSVNNIPHIPATYLEEVRQLGRKIGLKELDLAYEPETDDDDVIYGLTDLYPSFVAAGVPFVDRIKIRRHAGAMVTGASGQMVIQNPDAVFRIGDDVFLPAVVHDEENLHDQLVELVIESKERRDLYYERWRESGELENNVRNTPDVAEKVCLLATREQLIGLVGVVDNEMLQLVSRLDHRKLAEALKVVWGVDLFRRMKNIMSSRISNVPKQWTGSRKTRDFLARLGLPPEYAGSPEDKRDSYETVDGLRRIGVLHDYQRHVRTGLLDSLKNSSKMTMMSMPTGSGKTRVMIEALLKHMREGGRFRDVLWFAQSDELCEQAFQAWLALWPVKGPDAQLRLHRLWGRLTDELVYSNDGVNVVIATWQTLRNRIQNKQYPADGHVPALLVIDEAHSSNADSYRFIIDKLLVLNSKLLIRGMTATPFAGIDVDQGTRDLIDLYNGNMIDLLDIYQDPHAELMTQGILSQVRMETLQGADHFMLTPQEQAEFKQFQRFPDTAEIRLSSDASRHAKIKRKIHDCWQTNRAEYFPMLVFAGSTQHSMQLAMELSDNGITTSPVTAKTTSVARRHMLQSYRRGATQVLVNYRVLTTGYDEPRIRSVMIARPVYSPGLYQQMIGRGMRGPKNGGTDGCVIINVLDNIENYGQSLAFYEYHELWQQYRNRHNIASII